MKDNYVVAVSHIDLAFVIREEELAELLEIYLERVVNLLERHPDAHFALEQICHYRRLKKVRPQLFQKVKQLLKEGRLEMMGAMASTMETNFPNGECFVRNQLMGLKWAEENLEIRPDCAWLIDTFGINAQIPQILKQFGFKELFANRFGGDKRYDLFYAKGLDGSKLLVLGRDSYSYNLLPGSQGLVFCRSRNDIDKLFLQARTLQADWPHLVAYYIENEIPLSEYYMEKVQALDGQDGNRYRLSSYKEYIQALRDSDFEAPVIWGDLNPEFTGTYGLRNQIHVENRRAETLLLEADKWTALLGCSENNAELEECWWTMFFNQFHDVFSGSHEDRTYFKVLERFRFVKDKAAQALKKAMGHICQDGQTIPRSEHTNGGKISLLCINGLPWKRKEWIPVERTDDGWEQVCQDGVPLPMARHGEKLYFQAELPAVGIARFDLVPGKADVLEEKLPSGERCVIGNEYLSLDLDARDGIKALTLADGRKMMENAADFLTVQKDTGSFQIEDCDGTELYAMNGRTSLSEVRRSGFLESVELSGEFPRLQWNREPGYLKWKAEFTIRKDEPAVRLHLSLDWKGEAARIRFKLPCLVNAGQAVYEIPFGVVERSSYSARPTAKGEWPAHRFVAYEDSSAGLAVVNRGVAGVELNGQTLAFTLLRAYGEGPGAWVEPTEVSSQHGLHEYDFLLIPYRGSYKEADIVRRAQEFNEEVLLFEGMEPLQKQSLSYLEIDRPNLVLSGVKYAQDGSGEIVVRYYETYGEETSGVIYCPWAGKVFLSDVAERRGSELTNENGRISVTCRPFEIQTLRIVCRRDEAGTAYSQI